MAAMRDMAMMGPQAYIERNLASNPDFVAFAQSMSGKTPQEAFAERGLNFVPVQMMAQQMGLIR